MAHDPEMREAWESRTTAKAPTRRASKRGSSRRGKEADRKPSRAKGQRARRNARAVRGLASTVADTVGEMVSAILSPRGPAPTATPRPSPAPAPVPPRVRKEPTPMPTPSPSPGPPPPRAPQTREDNGDARDAFAEGLGHIARTRSYVSETSDELLERIPRSPRTDRLRRVLTEVRDWAEGRTKAIPVIPKGLPRSWPGRGARVSKLGIVLDLVTNLAEGDDAGEAVEDTSRATVFGVMGGIIATFTGPFRIIAGDAYAQFGANYDEYLAAAREHDRDDPVLREQRERQERTGYPYRCDQYSAMGFKPEDTEGCEK